jgi:ureidoacrylate peracid hydrolase
MMLNFKTVLVSDGCAAQTDAVHAAALHGFLMNFGDVYDTDEAIALLECRARQSAE